MRGGLAAVVLSLAVCRVAAAQSAPEPAPVAALEPRGPDGEAVPADRRPEDVPTANQTIVRGRRPLSADRTEDKVSVTGERLRDSPKPNLFEALAQESASIHVTRCGVGPEGVSSGASGGLTIRGLGGSPNTQVVVVEDGVPDVQGIFGHPLPDAFFMDLAVRYKYADPGKGWSVEPYLYLRNFLNRHYEYIQGYVMPGFNVLVGLKVGIGS